MVKTCSFLGVFIVKIKIIENKCTENHALHVVDYRLDHIFMTIGHHRQQLSPLYTYGDRWATIERFDFLQGLSLIS